MQTFENVVIAAAGMGKRLGKGMPKALVDVAGKKIIEYQLELFNDVPNLFIVVGFCDTDVINFVKDIRKDVIFVRNTNFKHTKTLESFYLAAKQIKGKTLFVDGDMIIPKKSYVRFKEKCTDDIVIGVSRRISEDPVYAMVDKKMFVTDFSYEEKSDYEWANVVYIEAADMESGHLNVFEFLKRFLPAKAVVIDRVEIDTEEDLVYATKLIKEGFLHSDCLQ